MRVLLDTFVWISFKEDKEFLKDFIKFYRSNDIEIVFSHGNFMDLAELRR
jgi:predicted nucleic acid-binding protein